MVNLDPRHLFIRVSATLAFGLLASGCGSDAKEGDAPQGPEAQARRALEELSPAVLPPPPQDPSNDFAELAAAASFGQRLFFEGAFSGRLLDGDNDGSENAVGRVGDTGKVACASCHVPETGFSDTRSLHQQISLGAGWGKRKAPSLLDASQSKLLMWDGRRDTFYNQVFGVLESAFEANSSRLFTAYKVAELYREDYEAVFGPLPDFDDTERFPALTAEETGCTRLNSRNECDSIQRGAPGDGAEYDGLNETDQAAVTRVVVNIGKALGAYQRLLTCGQSRFDEWMAGDDTALTESEQRGAYLFVGKAGCVQCHNGPYLSDHDFHNVGLKPEVVATVFLDANDPGAQVGITQAQSDELNSTGEFSDGDDGRLPTTVGNELLGAFKTPGLRCVSLRPSFMHTGHLRTLEEVVDFFNRGGDPVGYPGKNELSPLELSEEERADLVAFLRALDGPGPPQELLQKP